MSFLQQVSDEFLAQTLPEAVAVFCAIAYLLLAIRQRRACWLFAAASSAIYIWLFFAARLYMESALNFFYFAMAAYGYAVWSSGGEHGQARKVVVWPLAYHAAAISAIVILGAASGALLSAYTDAAYPYIDSLTTWFAIWATFLIARKVLENWWYWLVIDVVSIFIYLSRDLHLTAALFVAYVVMIPFGLLSWRRSMQSGGEQ